MEKNRIYKLRNPSLKFYCALCRTPREAKYRKNLTTKNYLQIGIISVMLVWLTFPIMAFKSLYLFFIVWTLFEVTNKVLYRRELPCPNCGFDPTWYRKDVKMAKRKVQEFFAKQEELSIGVDADGVQAQRVEQERGAPVDNSL